VLVKTFEDKTKDVNRRRTNNAMGKGQDGGFPRILRFLPSITLTILLKVTLSTITQHNP
jgi:hypothetical protein